MRFEMLMSTLHPFLIHAASSPRFSNLIKTHSQTPAHRRLARTLTSIVAAWRSAGFPFEDSMSTEMSSAQEIADVFDGKMTLRRLLALNEERKARCWASCEVKRMDVDPDDYGACQPGKLRSCGRVRLPSDSFSTADLTRVSLQCKVVRFVRRLCRTLTTLTPVITPSVVWITKSLCGARTKACALLQSGDMTLLLRSPSDPLRVSVRSRRIGVELLRTAGRNSPLLVTR